MKKEEGKIKVLELIEQTENLIPKIKEADLPPMANYPDIPSWHKYEMDIWQLGEKIRHLFIENKALREDIDLLNKIVRISINRNSKRGRQSFIRLLGNVKCRIYSDKLITQLDDKFVHGQIIDCIYKMRASEYVNQIKPFCEDKITWIKNIAKKYVEKYDH